MLPTSSLPPASAGAAVAAASGPAAEAVAGPKSKGAAKTGAPPGPASVADGAIFSYLTGGLPGLVRAVGSSRSTSTRRSSAAGYATATTAKAPAKTAGSSATRTGTRTAASKSDPLAFIRDPNLPLEEKLIKLLGYLNAKWDKELQDKLDKIGAGEKASSPTKSKKGGLLGGLGSAFSSALGGAGGTLFQAIKIPAVQTALKKLGGPVLAAAASALGFPAAAPLLLKYGPTVVDAALGIAKTVGASQGASSAKTTQATGAGGAAMSDSERQTVMMEIQNIRSKQQEMFGLVSNILKSNHDTRSAIIANIR